LHCAAPRHQTIDQVEAEGVREVWCLPEGVEALLFQSSLLFGLSFEPVFCASSSGIPNKSRDNSGRRILGG
jgi:hypothetical protein